MSFGTPADTRRRISFTFFTFLAILGAAPLSARAALFHMVDVQTATGDMVLTLINSATSYSGGQWNFTLQASNTGSDTYNDVNLMLQFVWDQAKPPAPPESALTYTSSNSWGGVVNSTTQPTRLPARARACAHRALRTAARARACAYSPLTESPSAAMELARIRRQRLWFHSLGRLQTRR